MARLEAPFTGAPRIVPARLLLLRKAVCGWFKPGHPSLLMEQVVARLVAALVFLVCQSSGSLAGSFCDVCGGGFGSRVVYFQDKVDGSRKALCESCGSLPTVCAHCGVPVANGYVRLSDGRVICGRDARLVVLDPAAALDICRETVSTLNERVGRFISIPEKNVRIQMMDRIDVQALYRIPGHDFSCPNVMGYTFSTRSREGAVRHSIFILTGQTRGDLHAVTAHEYAHVWMDEHVSKQRRARLDPNTREGFCELLAYLVAEARGEREAMRGILANGYTRGQVQLFLEAEKEYGFNDIVDWMKYGTTGRLSENNLAAIREVVMPRRLGQDVVQNVLFLPAASPPPATQLQLKGIIQGSRTSLAMINNLTLAEQEQGRARVGAGEVAIRCLKIGKASVVIEKISEGETLRLELSPESR